MKAIYYPACENCGQENDGENVYRDQGGYSCRICKHVGHEGDGAMRNSVVTVSDAAIRNEIASIESGAVPCWSQEDYDYRHDRLLYLKAELRKRHEQDGWGEHYSMRAARAAMQR